MLATLRRVYWETTAGCNLRCVHCRRPEALVRGAADELNTEEGLAFIDTLASRSAGRGPVLIFSGGEPLFRRDLFDLLTRAKARGLPAGLATNGTLVNERLAQRLRDTGVHYASISLDGITEASHDRVRGPRSFERAVEGMRHLQAAGLSVQINFTVTRQNVSEVPEMVRLARELRARALYLFLLVPVGCGAQIADEAMLGAADVEGWLEWVEGHAREPGMELRAICAPHYYRVKSRLHEGPTDERQGCLAGIHMAFLSHRGDVFPCGYLDSAAGNIRSTPFWDIWDRSPLLAALRDPGRLEGRCGACAYKIVCGGCRARAYAMTRNVLGEEPACTYDPAGEPEFAGALGGGWQGSKGGQS